VWLLWRRVITWQIPVGHDRHGVRCCAGGFHLARSRTATPGRWPASAVRRAGARRVLYRYRSGHLADQRRIGTTRVRRGLRGLLVYVIRTWGGYPEGVAFAVVLMNAMTPIIDHYIRPRAYGRTWDGKPRPVSTAQRKENG
jgi:electron transport complex protein RnfD